MGDGRLADVNSALEIESRPYGWSSLKQDGSRMVGITFLACPMVKQKQNEMQTMRDTQTESEKWAVFVQMRGMLFKAGSEHKARQEKSCGNAGSNSKISGKSWAGKGLGIRGPICDETPLSNAEVRFALQKRLV